MNRLWCRYQCFAFYMTIYDNNDDYGRFRYNPHQMCVCAKPLFVSIMRRCRARRQTKRNAFADFAHSLISYKKVNHTRITRFYRGRTIECEAKL